MSPQTEKCFPLAWENRVTVFEKTEVKSDENPQKDDGGGLCRFFILAIAAIATVRRRTPYGRISHQPAGHHHHHQQQLLRMF